jgi:hypothetical protein
VADHGRLTPHLEQVLPGSAHSPRGQEAGRSSPHGRVGVSLSASSCNCFLGCHKGSISAWLQWRDVVRVPGLSKRKEKESVLPNGGTCSGYLATRLAGKGRNRDPPPARAVQKQSRHTIIPPPPPRQRCACRRRRPQADLAAPPEPNREPAGRPAGMLSCGGVAVLQLVEHPLCDMTPSQLFNAMLH